MDANIKSEVKVRGTIEEIHELVDVSTTHLPT